MKSFTIIETLVAITILTVGILGISGLLSNQLFVLKISENKLVAAYLAQEGIEIVRNIRDSNYLKGQSWNKGISLGDWQADYKSFSLSPFDGSKLKIDPTNGFFNLGSGVETKFSRKISILRVDSVSATIQVTVYWKEKGIEHSFVARGKIYDWKP